jgi:hypothetical protein
MKLSIDGDVIKIKVGQEGVIFHVHENMLVRRSAFFRKALSGEWKESKDRTVELPENDPSTVALYCQAVYGRYFT